MQALSVYDRCGEARFASQFLARPLSQVRLFPAVRSSDGEIEETDDEKAREIFDRVQDPGGGGRTQLQGAYGRLKFLIGEAYLIASQDPDDTEMEQWEIVSPAELRLNTDRDVVRVRAPFMPEPVQLEGQDTTGALDVDQIRAWRLWSRHPAQSWLADSPMLPVLELFEQLILLQKSVGARILSRLAGNGILFIDDAITLPTPDNQEADEDPDADPLLTDLIEHFTTPIQEPGSASAVVPYLMRLGTGGRPIKDLIEYLSVRDPQEAFPEAAQVEQLLKRIGIGLDFPPEALLGVTDANHWTAWQVDDDTAKTYIFPACQAMADDFTSAYFQPACKQEGLTNWRDLVIGYDAAGLVNHPNRAQDAKDVFDRGELSGEGLRELTGTTEWEPSEEERNRILGVKLRDASVALYGIPTLKGRSGLEPAPGEIEAPPAPGQAPTTTEPGPPPAGPPVDDTPVTASANGNGQSLAMILGAAEFAITRARAAAGSRVRARRRSCESCFDGLDDVANGRLIPTLGADIVRGLKAPTAADLVAGAAAEFAETIARFGVDGVVANRLGELLEAHAAGGLYEHDPAPLPDGFAELVLAGVEAAQ